MGNGKAICQACYDKNFEKLVSLCKTLGSREAFYGFDGKNLAKETEIFLQVNEKEHAIEFLLYENLKRWYEKMKTLVKGFFSSCSICKNEFKSVRGVPPIILSGRPHQLCSSDSCRLKAIG